MKCLLLLCRIVYSVFILIGFAGLLFVGEFWLLYWCFDYSHVLSFGVGSFVGTVYEFCCLYLLVRLLGCVFVCVFLVLGVLLAGIWYDCVLRGWWIIL